MVSTFFFVGFAVLASLFISCLSLSENVTFLVVGDWGGVETSPYSTFAERRMALSMGKTAKAISSSFQISLGDNFYHRGVKNVDDPRFQQTFENVFKAPSLQSPWLVLLGNHDHYGNASAQIAYSKVSDRWHLPDFYYTKIYPIDDLGHTLQLVLIDTIILAGKTHPKVRSFPPSGPKSKSWAEEEWAWIEKTLAESTATWLIVAGHYPVLSAGLHGPTQLLVRRLKPLLEKYNASAYFSGHEHCLQHIHVPQTLTHYYGIGTGSYVQRCTKHYHTLPAHSIRYVCDKGNCRGSYASVSVTAKLMKIVIYSFSQQILYENIHANPRN